jgi:hypothetical protein
MGSLSRIRYGGGSRRDAYRGIRSSRELVERARAAAKRWEEQTDEPPEPLQEAEAPDEGREPSSGDTGAEANGEPAAGIEAAVDDGLQRLRNEAERLLAETETRFAALERKLRREQASLEEELAHRAAALVAASERQAEVADRLATEFGRLYSHRATFHPAAAHLAELQARIKALAAELTSGPRAAEKPE